MLRLTIEIDDDAAKAIAKIGDSQQMTAEQTAAYLLDRTLFGVSRRMIVAAEEYKPQSVMVMVDDSDDALKHFRCSNCGNIVFDYCGAVKLIMHGRYDRNNQLIDGEVVDATSQPVFGRPTVITCQGRMIVQFPNGRTGKVRCGNIFYKLRA